MIKRLFLITATLAVICGGTAYAEIILEKLRADLISSWLVTVEGEGRTRTLRILGVEQRDRETFSLDAAYGWTNGNQTAVRAEIRQTSQQRMLVLTTQPGSKIAANQQPDGTFTGTFTNPSGTTKGIKIARLSEDELRKAVSVLKAVVARTSFNTMGSDDSTAISGYDPVAFRSVKKALRGDPKLSYIYSGAKWIFATEENMKVFEGNPEKYLPAWGGHCAWAVSENVLSRKLLSGDFEIIDGKLYLFSFGNSQKSSARDDFLYGRWPRDMRIRDGDRYWPDLKRRLEDGSRAQANSKNYTKSRFEESR